MPPPAVDRLLEKLGKKKKEEPKKKTIVKTKVSSAQPKAKTDAEEEVQPKKTSKVLILFSRNIRIYELRVLYPSPAGGRHFGESLNARLLNFGQDTHEKFKNRNVFQI